MEEEQVQPPLELLVHFKEAAMMAMIAAVEAVENGWEALETI